MVLLNTVAKKSSSYVIDFVFTDEDGADPLGITSITWSLKKRHNGQIVNGREDVDAGTSGSFTIVLNATDTARTAGEPDERVVEVTIVYDSTNGSGLNFFEEVVFSVE